MTDTTLARTVRMTRLRAGLSLRQLAKKSGVSVGAIHRIENDSPMRPMPLTLMRLADALDLDVDELLDLAEAKSA